MSVSGFIRVAIDAELHSGIAWDRLSFLFPCSFNSRTNLPYNLHRYIQSASLLGIRSEVKLY